MYINSQHLETSTFSHISKAKVKTKNWAISLFSATAAVVMAVSTAIAQTAEINVSDVNVRSGPGVHHGIRGTFPRGVRGTIINRSGDWVYVVTGRLEGWVYAPYITIVGSGSGGDSGTGGGTITPGPMPSRYESIGSITNARFQGGGTGSVQVIETNRVVVNVTARGENIQPFTMTYYGAITSRSRGQIAANVTAFASSPTGNQTIPTSGNCQMTVSVDSSAIRAFICHANGTDHGRTVFNVR